MAFVYRKNKQKQLNPNQTPGPGDYNAFTRTVFTNSAVSFSDKVPRKLWPASTNPGPGEYNTQTNSHQFEGTNILSGSVTSGLCITDSFFNRSKGCSSTFKSKSKRLVNHLNQTPGPGQYEIKNIKQRNENRRSESWQKSTKLTRYLYEQTKKQNRYTPQIPKKQEQVNKSLLGSGIHVKQQQKTDAKQPKYNYKSVFNSKVQRTQISRPQTATGVGPGSYNVAQFFKKADRKSFNCKSSQPQINYQDQKNACTKQQVGPGHYQIQTSSFKRPQTSQSKGIACFGSKQTRFVNQAKSNCCINPGPQSYFKESSVSNKENIKQQKKKVPFDSGVEKSNLFSYVKSSKNFNEVSPCSYYPRNDFNQLLKKNYIKGTVGRFGSTVQRFKQAQQDQNKTAESNEKNCVLACKPIQSNHKKNKNGYSFQNIKKHSSNTQKFNRIDDQSQIDRPLCYDTNSKTISNEYAVKKQIEAPFLTGSQRFAFKKINYSEKLLNQLKLDQEKFIILKGHGQSSQTKGGKIHKGIPKNNSILKKYMQTVQRLKNLQLKNEANEEKDQYVGPQTYHPNLLCKKSYNVLFQP